MSSHIIFFISPLIILGLTIIAFQYKNYPIGIISGLAWMTWGVVVLINGINGLGDLESLFLGVVSIGVGAYLSIVGSIDYIEELSP